MIEIYVVVTGKTSWKKNFEIFKIKNRGKKMFKKFPSFFLKLCFRDTPLVFLQKNALIVYCNIYFTQIFHRGKLVYGVHHEEVAVRF